MNENEISTIAVDCAYKVHKTLGPGLLESVYEECLNYEFSLSGLKINRQMPLPVIYNSIKMNIAYRVDFLINDKVIIEIKAIEGWHDIHAAQVLTYLKLSKCKLGLLINFNVTLIKYGIKRIVFKLDN